MWPVYSKELRKDVDALLKKGGSLSAYRANRKFGLGPSEGSWAYRLEREIEKRFKVKHVVAVNSGTAALHAALSALDIQGKEVITSPYTFSATTSAVLLAGGIPVFADVDPYSFCLSKETVKHVITKKTKAILPVDLFGGLAPYKELRELGLPIVEDGCQAVGASLGGVYAGSFGDAGAMSFNGSKNIPAGEGGALVTNSDKIAEKARLLVNHAENFGVDAIGLNYRMNELTACVAYHGLLALRERNRKRKQLVVRLVNEIVRLIPDFPEKLFLQIHGRNQDHVYYVYPFKVRKDRAGFIKRMAKRGVTVGAGYINPTLEKYPAFRRYCKKPLPVVTELSEKTLCLLYCLTPDKPLSYAEKVAEAMKESLR